MTACFPLGTKNILKYKSVQGFPGGSVKNPPAKVGHMGSILMKDDRTCRGN